MKNPKAANTKLTKEQRSALAQIRNHPGYEVLLQLMEMQCVLQDAEMLAIPTWETEKVVAEHAITVAKYEFFQQIQAQVEHEANEAHGAGNEIPDTRSEIEKVLLP